MFLVLVIQYSFPATVVFPSFIVLSPQSLQKWFRSTSQAEFHFMYILLYICNTVTAYGSNPELCIENTHNYTCQWHEIKKVFQLKQFWICAQSWILKKVVDVCVVTGLDIQEWHRANILLFSRPETIFFFFKMYDIQ